MIPCGARFSAPNQKDRGGHPNCNTITEALNRVKGLTSSLEHLPTSIVDVKEKLELYLHYDSGN
jgi:hypothetical protein